MRHRYDPLYVAQLRRHERKLYDSPTPEALHTCAAVHASGLGRYLSPQIVELAKLAYVAEWLANRDDPAAHAHIAQAAVRFIVAEN